MPISWREPFGMVMVEALAAGTPVIAFPQGAASEIVVNGRNGYLVSDEREMAASVASSLDRSGSVPSRRRCALRRDDRGGRLRARLSHGDRRLPDGCAGGAPQPRVSCSVAAARAGGRGDVPWLTRAVGDEHQGPGRPSERRAIPDLTPCESARGPPLICETFSTEQVAQCLGLSCAARRRPAAIILEVSRAGVRRVQTPPEPSIAKSGTHRAPDVCPRSESAASGDSLCRG